ncbi:hypothetical protein AB0I89_23975 [Micromonospora sp. NPDC049801]|uniref:hypothetical protein n=1 Tax=unclassified Micromonospora TaxID=2617518 RepID=UPI0033F3B9C8
MKVLLRHGPADGRVVDGGGETVVAGACLYERTGERANRRGEDLPVYVHRADCCEANQRGVVDGCE